MITGAILPLFGGFLMSRVMTQLTVPLDYYPILFPGKDMEEEITMYCLWMAACAAGSFLSMFI